MAIESYVKEGRTLWRASVKIRDLNKRQITRQQGNLTTEAQAKKAEFKLMTDLVSKKNDCGRYRWNEWTQHCFQKMRLRFQGSTMAGYEAYIKKWVNPVFGELWIERITINDIHNLIFSSIHGVSPSTRKTILKHVKRLFNMAVEEGILTKNPCLGLKVKVPEPRRLVLNQTEISTLLNKGQAIGHPFYNHWVLALLTGMRSGELFALNWTDIDFENGYISVNKGWNKFNGMGPTKNSQNRIVPISKELERFLKGLRLRSSSENVLERCRDWQTGCQASVLKKFCEEIGITPVKFHDLRATFITQLLLKGVPVAKVMAIVGHAELKTTMHYVRLVGADVMGVTDTLGIEVPRERSDMNNVVSLF